MAQAKPIIFYDNRFLDGTPEATDTAEGYSVYNLRDWRIFSFWKAASVGTKYLSVDCGEAKSASALAVVGHNFKAASATISVESSPDDSDWTERLAGFVPANDYAFMKQFTPVSARYWRIKIVAAAVVPYCAVAIVGVPFVFERYLVEDFDPDEQEIVAHSANSKAGHLLGVAINYIKRNIAARWRLLTPDWVESSFLPIWHGHLSQIKPFFWAWEITGHPSEVYFVRLVTDSVLSMPYDPVRRNLVLRMEGINEISPIPSFGQETGGTGEMQCDYGSAPPTQGYHEVSFIRWNSAPQPGENAGWICVVAGTPGTFHPFGVISLDEDVG